MTFKEFLIEKNIPFTHNIEEDSISVDDNDIIPYELEFREKVPEGEFIWDYQRYRCEPKRIGD